MIVSPHRLLTSPLPTAYYLPQKFDPIRITSRTPSLPVTTMLLVMGATNLSVAIIVSAGGAVLDHWALREMPQCRVIGAEFEASNTACCAAVRLSHRCSRAELQRGLRTWAGGRGWSVAVAPCPESR